MSEFERENRYIVIKRKDVRAMDQRTDGLNHSGFSGAMPATSRTATEKLLDDMAVNTRNENNKPPLECLVIESDWPEYEVVWQMIQKRMSEVRP